MDHFVVAEVPNTSVFTSSTSVTLPESALALNTKDTTSVIAFNAPVNPAGLGSVVFTKQFNRPVGVLPTVFDRTPGAGGAQGRLEPPGVAA